MMRLFGRAVVAALALGLAVSTADAGDCTGFVVGVRPIGQYDPAAGTGFLAVRLGPGTQYRQISELYLGDEIAVWDRLGAWYRVQCMSGRCLAPIRGRPNPNGWVSGRYLSVAGVCP